MERHRKQIASTLVLASALIAAVATFLLPPSLQAQTQAQPKGIDPALLARANAGDAKSQFLVGSAYYMGESVQWDLAQAETWYRKAAENGDSTAQFALGWAYLWGSFGIAEDHNQAMVWFRKAAEHTSSIEMNKVPQMIPVLANPYSMLGFIYEDGKDLPQDYSQAAFWYRKGAEQGAPDAQSAIGSLYADGKGVPQDYGQAVAWYQKAANQGSIIAQSNLGTLYLLGHGVPQDYKQAVEWLTKAANDGEPHAQYNLAVLYWRGQGVPENDAVAYLWFDLAAARLTGPDRENAEKGRDACATQLTPEVLSKAQEIASKWFAAHPPKSQ
jgi:TPR repeat protein